MKIQIQTFASIDGIYMLPKLYKHLQERCKEFVPHLNMMLRYLLTPDGKRSLVRLKVKFRIAPHLENSNDVRLLGSTSSITLNRSSNTYDKLCIIFRKSQLPNEYKNPRHFMDVFAKLWDIYIANVA